MKTIILFRHGKSDWDASHDDDHDRPLAPRGRKAAIRMGQLLAKLKQVPDKAISSSALRAGDTVRLAVEAGCWDCPVEIAPEFYGASVEEVIARVRKEDDARGSLLLAGHEPTWSETASALIDGGTLRFPTAAMARIDLIVECWAEVRPGCGMLVWFLIPRLFAHAGRIL